MKIQLDQYQVVFSSSHTYICQYVQEYNSFYKTINLISFGFYPTFQPVKNTKATIQTTATNFWSYVKQHKLNQTQKVPCHTRSSPTPSHFMLKRNFGTTYQHKETEKKKWPRDILRDWIHDYNADSPLLSIKILMTKYSKSVS